MSTALTMGALMMAGCVGFFVGVVATTTLYWFLFPTFKEKLFELCTVMDSTGLFGDHKTERKE